MNHKHIIFHLKNNHNWIQRMALLKNQIEGDLIDNTITINHMDGRSWKFDFADRNESMALKLFVHIFGNDPMPDNVSINKTQLGTVNEWY